MSFDAHGDFITLPAAADLSDLQYTAITIDASGNAASATTGGVHVTGILQDNPDAADKAASVQYRGVSKAVAGETLAPNDPVGPGEGGKFFVMDEEDEAVLGRVLVGASVDEKFPLLITHEGSAAANQEVEAFVAAADYRTTGQNLLMAIDTTAGRVIKASVAGQDVIGVLVNAPNAAAQALVKSWGPATVTAGTGNFAAGDRLASDAAGQCVVAVAGDTTVGYGMAAVVDGSTGLAFITPGYIQDVAGTALAATNFWVGNVAGVAAAVAMGGDATMDNAGAVTVIADAIDATKMGSTGTGVIFKGAAADVVTELPLAEGAVPIGLAGGDVGSLAMSGAAGDLMVSNGTTGVVVPIAGDITLDGAGDTEVVDLTLAAEAQGDVAVRGAANWEALSLALGLIVVGDGTDAVALDVSTVDQVLVGDGTTLASVPMTGDVAIDAAGDTEVSDLTMAAETQGDIIRRGAAVWEVHPALVAGQILVGDGADITSVAVSGDAALAAGGALTLAKGFIRQITTNWDAAAVVACNATALVLADFSVLEAAGIVASGDALIFHHVIANLYGGTVNYDQNQNVVINYGPNGAGATTSLTLANWLDGNPAGSLTDIKQLATVVVPDPDEDLDWLASASPFNAAGDRLLRVTLYYSVYTPAT